MLFRDRFCIRLKRMPLKRFAAVLVGSSLVTKLRIIETSTRQSTPSVGAKDMAPLHPARVGYLLEIYVFNLTRYICVLCDQSACAACPLGKINGRGLVFASQASLCHNYSLVCSITRQ